MTNNDQNTGWTLLGVPPTVDPANSWLQNKIEVYVESYRARFEWPPEYPRRFNVADENMPWDVDYPEYAPVYYVAPVVLENDCTQKVGGWADPEDISQVEALPSESFEGPILLDAEGRPLNPRGRSGLAGRGLLGKWGPNYAADPIITRVNQRFGDVEMLAIQRKDNGQWAIPGGMVDKGEAVSATLSRELKEEAGVELDFAEAQLVYQGFVDDRRTTDNAWIESTVKHLHLVGEQAEKLEPEAGSDALSVTWLPLTERSLQKLYASHGYFVVSALGMLYKRQPDALPAKFIQILAAYF
ncbi:MAG: NUDIX domain-containing protein [Syntrophotaleaceae bacterium]